LIQHAVATNGGRGKNLQPGLDFMSLIRSWPKTTGYSFYFSDLVEDCPFLARGDPFLARCGEKPACFPARSTLAATPNYTHRQKTLHAVANSVRGLLDWETN